MALSRAEIITQTSKKLETYSDFADNFTKNPLNDQLVTITNEASVRQAIKNLILTNVEERLFNPYFGSNIRRALFEPFGPFVIEDIVRYVTVSISQHEPRAILLNVQVIDESVNNGIRVNIVFALINNPNKPILLSVFLKRVR